MTKYRNENFGSLEEERKAGRKEGRRGKEEGVERKNRKEVICRDTGDMTETLKLWKKRNAAA